MIPLNSRFLSIVANPSDLLAVRWYQEPERSLSDRRQKNIKRKAVRARKLFTVREKEYVMDIFYFALGTVILVFLMVAARRSLGA